MGDIGYIYGYLLALVAFISGLVGWLIGRWMK